MPAAPPFFKVKMVNRVFNIIEIIVRGFNKILVFIASLMMAGLMIIVCVDLSLRYFFNSPLLWGTEVTEILLLYITFLGMAWVFKEEGHVVIDVFTAKVMGRKKKILNGMSYFFVGIVSVVLIYYGFYTAIDHFKRGVFNPTVIETPIALIIVVIPIGSIPLFLEVLVKSWKLLKH
ncbi:MAG: TRAP transporter small permease subunit [Syntrophaceae bacterium]|nr:TRAP transporter small permease subunit [Syntrophaceae bacterium]